MQLERSLGSLEELQCRKCFGPNNSLAEGFPNSPCHTWLWPLPPSQPYQQEAPSHQHTPNEAPSQALSPCPVLHSGTQGTRDSNTAICLPCTKRNTNCTQIWLRAYPCQADPFPRRIFPSVLSSLQRLAETGGYLQFQVQILKFAENSMQIESC